MASSSTDDDSFQSSVKTFSNLRLTDGGCVGNISSIGAPQNMLTSSVPSNHANIEILNERKETNEAKESRRGTGTVACPQYSSSPESYVPTSTNPGYHWQATKTTVKERFSFLFNNETLSDVHFIVGRDSQQQKIPAHRFVLTVGSGVFDAMFNGTLATQAETIDLPDVEPAAFLALLRFLYSDEVCIEPETVMTTLYTAKKYVVPALEKHCVEFLKGNLCSENAFLLLTQARLFDEPQLAALCLDTIDQSTAEAFAADGFVDVDLDTLAAVLERDTLRIREAKVFQAVVRWSEAECGRQHLPPTPENRRSVLGRVLHLVRFPLMTVEEFAVGAAQSGLLTDREVVSLFLYFTVNPKPNVPFVDSPRCCMTGKEQTGPDSHYGTKGLRKVVLDCPSGGKVTFQFSYAAGNNNGTSVEDGQIPEIIFYI
ncbi:hypothetical protein J437_LFUL013411 [Ladona fulva]|uniref:BTB domain-containing protein n=1 Tax=Ladona fulva TaxID=123851 RepID=A0A8K0KEC5_LADFU|nr:hypothetical protein J437_LFUL013411 [Ladona fulva]